MTYQLNWPSVKYFLKDYALALVYEDYKRWPYCCLGWTKWGSYTDFWAGLKQLVVAGYVPFEVSDFFEFASVLILPRSQRFRKVVYSHPADMTMEEWEEKLDAIIFSFQFVVDKRSDDIDNEEMREKVEKGFKLFGEYFRHLWL